MQQGNDHNHTIKSENERNQSVAVAPVSKSLDLNLIEMLLWELKRALDVRMPINLNERKQRCKGMRERCERLIK